MKRREFLAAPLALAACAGVAPSKRGPSGWAGLEGGLAFADAIRPEHRFNVSSRAELDAALALGDTPKLIRVHGRIDLAGGRTRADFVDREFDFDAYCRAYSPEAWGRRPLSGALEEARKRSTARQSAAVSVRIAPRTIIAGATPDAGFVDGTLMLQDTHEVIVANLHFHGVRDHFPAWDPLDGAQGEWNSEYDAVSLRRARRVWVDHCEFESIHPARERIFGRVFETNDGLLDITLASDLVTVSWCRFGGHEKTMLIGGSNRHTSDDGHLRVTLSHNLWERCAERTPRVRFGQVHIANNLFVPGPNYVYSIGMGLRCQIVSEANAWEVPEGFDEGRIVRDWGGTRFSDRGSVLNGRPLALGAAIRRVYPNLALDEQPAFEPPPVDGVVAGAAVAVHVRALASGFALPRNGKIRLEGNAMTTIREEDFVQSVADAFQYISYYHPVDYIRPLVEAYSKEQSPAAKDAMAQILINSRMAAEGHRPICQDTGIAIAFIRVGMDVRWDTKKALAELVDEGVRRAYTDKDNPLRGSMLTDPDGKRKNTGDNTPAVTHVELVPGDKVEVIVAAKGGGSENKSKFAMLLPSDSIVDWVLSMVPTMGADWCPPGLLSIGIGGSPEKAMLMAKWAMMEPLNFHELRARGPKNRAEELRIELYDKVNALGIGAQGLDLSTVLDVKVTDYPTHAASKPVALLPNCAATRHAHFVLDGSGPAKLDPPSLDEWPKLEMDVASSRRVNLDALTPAEIATWKAGERLLLSGKLLTGRDAAHKRMVDMLSKGEKLPVDFKNRFIYYVGPVSAVRDEAVGPAGPTTSSRMDRFVEPMLAQTGLIGMVGKSERGPVAIEAIRKHRAVYCIAVGGAAYLVSKAIRKSRVLAFQDLGMEAIHEFEVKDMPVTVAVDSTGGAVHKSGPAEWRAKIGKIPVTVA